MYYSPTNIVALEITVYIYSSISYCKFQSR